MSLHCLSLPRKVDIWDFSAVCVSNGIHSVSSPHARRSYQPLWGMERTSVEVWCRSTLPLQMSDTRAVHLVTAGNHRGGLRDRSRPPELECVAHSNCCFFVIGSIANFVMGKIEPALLLCTILGKLFGAKAAFASDNS